MDRTELASFLRSRRARVQPADVGITAGRRRRTPGLRREEVAQLAAISADYYTRLEQARGPRPSREVLSALARALRLSREERDYLFDIACATVTARATPAQPRQDVAPGVLHLLDRLDDTAAVVLDAKGDVLAWNPLAAALLIDFSRLPPGERNLAWLLFGANVGRDRYTSDDVAAYAREVVADLRAAAGRYPADPGIRRLVRRLRVCSPEFAAMWTEHEVRINRGVRKVVDHPVVGPVELDCEVLLIAERDQRLLLYTTPPGSPSREALRLLQVVGLQQLAAGRPEAAPTGP